MNEIIAEPSKGLSEINIKVVFDALGNDEERLLLGEEIFCLECGAKIKKTDRFCLSCGKENIYAK